MKYLITESQLDKAILKFLDSQNFDILKKGASTYFVNSDDWFAQIKYGGRHRNDELCFIYFELIQKVSSFFSIESYKAESVIGQWVKKKLNLGGNMTNHKLYSQWSLKLPTED
jgi:hypothetical protein